MDRENTIPASSKPTTGKASLTQDKVTESNAIEIS